MELRLSRGEGVLPAVAAFGCGQCGFIRLHVDPATGFDLANPPAVEALRPRARTSPT